MALVKARRLARDWRINPDRTLADLKEALEWGRLGKPGGLNPQDFSIRDLAEELMVDRQGNPCGYQWVKEVCNPRVPVEMQEAMNAVDSTAFINITGQLLVRSVLQEYANPAFVMSAAVPTEPSPFTRGEKIPGISLPRSGEGEEDAWFELGEAEDYKMLGFAEEYIETPATKKRGLIIGITREMIFEDLTGLAVRRAQYVGTMLGMNKEKRLTDLLIGYTNNYKEKRRTDTASTALATYYSATDSGRWTNHQDGNELADWASLDVADALFADMSDPNTGEPIVITTRMIIHMPQKRSTVARILNATELRQTTNSNNLTISANVVRPGLTAMESVWAYRRLQSKMSVSAADAKDYWFYGDPARAFRYLENWPITVMQAANNSEAEFNQDILIRYKATERGVAAVMDPRFIQRHRKLSTSSSSGAL